MTTARAQLDAAEARFLDEWRSFVRGSQVTLRFARHERPLREWELKDLRVRERGRAPLATAIRAIRAQRKALDAERDGWQLVHVDELTALRASMEFACVTPSDNCDCSGCMAAAAFAREMT